MPDDKKKTSKNKIKRNLLHRFVWTFLWVIAQPYMAIRYGFKTKHLRLKEPCLVVSNHLTEIDMIMVGCAFPRQMYIVGGEHIQSRSIFPVLDFFFHPITMYKADSDTAAIKEIIRRLRAGHSIMLFPEGSRSFNGETETLTDSIGKLCKSGKCGLVTYHLGGGYFTAPRWAYTTRKGRMWGEIKSYLTADEVAKMSPHEITELINRDIHDNAYETQRVEMNRYTGERLAEGLENYLIICPSCGEYNTLETSGNEFKCPHCGLHGKYNEYGFLEGENLPFDNVYDWGKWVEKKFREDLLGKQPDELLYTDSDLKFYEIAPDHERITLEETGIKGYSDRIEIGGSEFDFSEISGMDMLYYGKTLMFTWRGRHFGLTGENFHAVRYKWTYDYYLTAR